MKSVRFTNSTGTSLDISTSSSSFLLSSIDGIGSVEADIQSQQSPYQDGVNYIDTLLQARPIPIVFTILADTPQELATKRRLVSNVFNPKKGLGLLEYRSFEDRYEINGTTESVPDFPSGRDNRGVTWQKVMVDILCPNPYWRNPNQTSQPLKAYVGNFTLPFTLPFELGMSGSRTTLYNEGDIPAPIRIDIQGPVTNPQIINRTTGEWLKINRSIAADEVLHINTTPGKKRVEIYRGNEVYPALGYMDHDSDWIKLELGKNEIEHIADAGDRESLIAVTWNSMYVGI
ncbi:phage tail family protein [Virgibacillus halodenitrificans]|uniref:phage tail family protein n=1 Tax=Virgibacillus halodenitrificans TaxID=1482 RepID=UPI0013685D15|nr:phage tail family protein [Virgibacillus halodenitrificans]MYL44583.1 phage tail family protein [Virgibacillus halodenitrificans]